MIFDKPHFSLHKTLAINPEFTWFQFLMLRAVENILDRVQGLDSAASNSITLYSLGIKRQCQFLNFDLTDMWGWTILCCMSCPVHCRKFNSTPSLYSLTEPLFQLWQSKISPDFAKYPLGGRITLLLLWEPLFFFFFLPHFMTCWNLSFPARDRTDGPCFGSAAS